MIEYVIKTVEEKVAKKIKCDVCKKEYSYESNEDYLEIQEFHHIRRRGGYSSVFGDDVGMKCDICQHCLDKLLGEYLLVDEEGEVF